MKALRRLLGYMNTTKNRQLVVPRVWSNEWHMYSDSDHAGEAYTGDSRSHTGVMILLNGMPIHKKNTALGKYDTAIGRKGASQDRALQW